MPEFELSGNYSCYLLVVGVTFLYSAGMPVLYPIAALFFIITYWVDKLMLIRFCRQPPVYDSYLARYSLSWYKFILLMHVAAGVFMFSNSSLCPSKFTIMSSANEILRQANSSLKVEDFFQIHVIVFVALSVGAGLIYLVWLAIHKCLSDK